VVEPHQASLTVVCASRKSRLASARWTADVLPFAAAEESRPGGEDVAVADEVYAPIVSTGTSFRSTGRRRWHRAALGCSRLSMYEGKSSTCGTEQWQTLCATSLHNSRALVRCAIGLG
jgi:hypothetical protein